VKRLAIAAMLSTATALLACGCLWGHVRDAQSGAELSGATVSWVDGNGTSNSQTTGLPFAEGLYIFDWTVGPIPHKYPVTFTVTAPGYQPLVEQRVVAYDDNPNPDPDDPSSFWEIQDFSLVPIHPSPHGPPPQPPPPPPTNTPVPPPTPTPLPRSWPTNTPVPSPR